MKRLPLLDGLRWTGHLEVLQVIEEGYVVSFHAYSEEAGEYIYDQVTLTGEQVLGWTGVTPREIGK